MLFKPRVLIFCSLALLVSCATTQPARQARFATFNVAMGLSGEGELQQRLESGNDPGLVKLAEILQRVRPDVILLNEFDYTPGSAELLRRHYLEVSRSGLAPIEYPFTFLAPVNTGIDSGLDLDNNGQLGDPSDAWGFGNFPGQYGMLVLSRFPLLADGARTFRHFLWRDMPGALRPVLENGESYYPQAVWEQLRLSSKSHWDLPLEIHGSVIHFLASHPTPTVFDGQEDRNGRRNHDENRIWADYIQPGASGYLVDDSGRAGGLAPGSVFVIAGDLNADPLDGNWMVDSTRQLLQHPQIDATCIPRSRGGAEAHQQQAGINLQHAGDPSTDTSDFNDEYTGNLRVDYVLPSRGLSIQGCGVYWPGEGEAGHELPAVSDHRLVWLDIEL
jgi:endonuclease/exonuclease/phosphatase family metal-dependent hydrolase